MINKYAAKEIIKAAPDSPGCYLFKDKSGAVIYAGKSKNLRRRVGQYFYPGAAGHTPKNLAGAIAEAEYVTAGTELNTLLLEYRLIKRYKPRYNSQLKAEVKHPYLRITAGAEYPALSAAQEKSPDAARYYGFLYDTYDAQDALRILHRAWRVPVCGKDRFSPRTKACLYYHIGNCLGPCEGLIAPAAYRGIIGEILRFLDGGRTGVMSRIHSPDS